MRLQQRRQQINSKIQRRQKEKKVERKNI